MKTRLQSWHKRFKLSQEDDQIQLALLDEKEWEELPKVEIISSDAIPMFHSQERVPLELPMIFNLKFKHTELPTLPYLKIPFVINRKRVGQPQLTVDKVTLECIKQMQRVGFEQENNRISISLFDSIMEAPCIVDKSVDFAVHVDFNIFDSDIDDTVSWINHLSSIDKAPNDTRYFSQNLIVKPIESC
jgi:hypothetical protein